MSRERLDELREERRREGREIPGCTGTLALLWLAAIALVFVGCPMAASYGVSRGCAAGAERAR